MKQANRIVAEAAAKGELLIINQENRQLFGLDIRHRHVDGDGWRAWWSRDVKAGSTGGITHAATRFHVATTALAPDGSPWPQLWSLGVFRQHTTPGQEFKQLAYARKFERMSAHCGFTLLTPAVGGSKPATVRCHCCQRVRQHEMAQGLINPRYNPARCFAQEDKGKSGATLMAKSLLDYTTWCGGRGYRIVGEWKGIHKPTAIYCGSCGDVHRQRPKDLRRCGPTCQGSRQQTIANGKVSKMELSAAAQATGIPALMGTATDAPWRVLTGKQERGNDATDLYLWQTAVAMVRNFGIAYDTAQRARTHHPDNVVALFGTRRYPDRDTAVLIEGAIKHLHACPMVPPGLEGRGNVTEYTLLTDAEFWVEVDRLEEELQELGPVEFVRGYCHPWEIQHAERVGILAQYLVIAQG